MEEKKKKKKEKSYGVIGCSTIGNYACAVLACVY